MTSLTRGERWAAWIWGLVLLGCALLLANLLSREAPLDTRITALLPDSHQTILIERAENRLMHSFEDRLAILVSGENPASLVADLEQQLESIGRVTLVDEAHLARPEETLSPYRYRLLSESLVNAGDESWERRALTRLFTPGIDADPRHDPFGLLDTWLRHRLDSPIHLENGLPAVTAGETLWYVISGQLNGSPYSMAVQQRITQALAEFRRAHPQAVLLRAGLVFHAAAGAAQAKSEISTIGLGSLLGIVLLLWGVFRRGKILLSLLMPVGCGLLFALPLSWVIFGTLNLITLAFGASLIGIAVDYALHLQCARQLMPKQPLSRLWPGLWLGLVSSLVAYLVQLATPLPGLRQMATFAVLGLLGSWLTVRLWLPLFTPKPHPATARVATSLNQLRLPSHATYHWALLILLGILAGILVTFRLSTSDDLRQLNPSPERLITEQQRVQKLLKQASSNHYLIVTAKDESDLLQRLEALDPTLLKLNRQGHLAHYRHLAKAVPSPAIQEANLKRVHDAYAHVLPQVIAQTGLPGRMLETALEPLQSAPELTIQKWLEMPLGQADRVLWLGEVSDTKEGSELATLVLLGDSDTTAQRVLTELANRPYIHYQNRVAVLSSQLAHLRDAIGAWLGVAIVGLALVFGWRYRGNAWRVLLPPLGALMATLAFFSALGTGLTLFHLLGLLLVLGIGLDAGIFSAEHPKSPAAWLAISLSCASSVMAFGLLAFSATPALHYLGLTCLIGLTATWVLVPFSRAATAPLIHDHQVTK